MIKKIIAIALALITVLGVMSTVSFAETGEATLYDTFSDNKLGETQSFTDTATGLTAKLTTYVDDNYESNSAVIIYVINHDGEYPGLEEDDSIISDFLKEGYTVVVADYFGNNGLAKSPAIEESLTAIRKDIVVSAKYLNGAEIDTSKTYVVPAGYRIERDVVYFDMSKSATQAALTATLNTYNTNRVAGAFYYYPYTSASNDVSDAEHPFRHMVDVSSDGKFSFKDEYKAKSLYDIMMRDGTKMTDDDMQLKMDIVYPSQPITETPVAVLAASGTPRNGSVFSTSHLARIHGTGFLFRGYTFVCYDHEFFPFMNVDAGGWDDGLASRAPGEFGNNINYTTQQYDGVKTHTAAIRCIKYYADEFGYSKEKIGVYGHSKSSFVSLLTSSSPENIVEGDKYAGKPLGEQPFLTDKEGNSLDASITCAYHSMGNGSSRSRYIVNSQCVPTMIACGQKDTGTGCQYWESEKTAYRNSNSEFIAIDMIDIGHDFPYGVDPVYNYDRYVAFCKFFDYYLKDTAPEILYSSLVDGKIKGIETTTYLWTESQSSTSKQWKEINGDKLFVQFTAPVTEWSFLEAVSLKDSNGEEVEGSWYAEGNGNKWIFAGKLSSSETYTLTIADNTVKDKYGRTVKKGYNTEGDTELIPLTDDVDLKLLGRAGFVDGKLTADHAASGMSLVLECEGYVGLNITTAKAIKLSVTVDGTTKKNVAVGAGTSNLTIAENLTSGLHTVKIINETGLIDGSKVDFNSISLNGSVCNAPKDSGYLIEFIGDSISAGYGLSEASEGNHHDATLSYAYLTADILGVDYSILAKSGMGIVYGYGEDNFFENVYPYANYNRGTTKFVPSRTPDIVVINLNTNDNSLWTAGEDYTVYDAKFGEMIATITTQYGKDVPMLFVFGCMANETKTKATDRSQYLIENVYTAENGYDIKVVTLSASKDGKDSHPTAEGAKVQAEELVAFIKKNYEDFDDTKRYTKMQSVILMGQSNMVGRGLQSAVDVIENDKILEMNSDGEWVKMEEPLRMNDTNREDEVSLGASFAKAFVDTFDREIGLVPVAKGGSSIYWWQKGYTGSDDEDLYEKAVEYAIKAQETSEICAILWHQGETNKNLDPTIYATQLKKMLDNFIADVGLDRDKIVIITGELGEWFGNVKIHEGLYAIADEGYYENYDVVSSKGLTSKEDEKRDDNHFDSPSLRVFGYRYFEKFYEALTDRNCTYDYSQDPDYYRISSQVE